QNQKRQERSGGREGDPAKQVIAMSRPLPAVEFISNLMFSGVFDRHPQLRVVCTEFDCSWVAGTLERLDYTFSRESTYDPEKNVMKRKPSEYFQENMFFTFCEDRAGVLNTPFYGADNYLWSSDYPHHST